MHFEHDTERHNHDATLAERDAACERMERFYVRPTIRDGVLVAYNAVGKLLDCGMEVRAVVVTLRTATIEVRLEDFRRLFAGVDVDTFGGAVTWTN